VDRVVDVSFTSNRLLAAVIYDDGTARLWDPVRREVVTTLTREAGIRAIAFGATGDRLAVLHRDSTLELRHLVLAPRESCALVAGEVSRAALVEALGGDEPAACRDLR